LATWREVESLSRCRLFAKTKKTLKRNIDIILDIIVAL